VHPLPAHLRRLTDSAYLAAALGVFLAAAAIQLGLFLWLLRPALAASDVGGSRRWLLAALGCQVVVLVAAGAYVFVSSRAHPAGFAWIAPPLAALLGTALPLQLAVASALRAARR
jgi:uncharacterized membrane protein YbhN (UPF0104 family)